MKGFRKVYDPATRSYIDVADCNIVDIGRSFPEDPRDRDSETSFLRVIKTAPNCPLEAKDYSTIFSGMNIDDAKAIIDGYKTGDSFTTSDIKNKLYCRPGRERMTTGLRSIAQYLNCNRDRLGIVYNKATQSWLKLPKGPK